MKIASGGAALLFFTGSHVLAQVLAVRAVPDEPNCPRCTISMQPLVTLGTDDGVGSLIGKPMSVNIDSRGRYWVFQELEPPTVFHANGSVDRVIQMPVTNPTCPAFGGEDLDTLYITSHSQRFTAEQLAAEPLAGCVLAFDAGVRGLPEPRFAG